MLIIRTLIGKYDFGIMHNGIKTILVFKNANDVLYWTKKNNILYEEVCDIKNIELFKIHLKKENLNLGIYNRETNIIDIYSLEQL